MMATKRATKASCLAAAKKRFGKYAFVRENQNALTAAERKTRLDQAAESKVEIEAIGEQIKSLGNTQGRLLEAAEFFLSVNGDEPSGTQFREAVANARLAVDLIDTRTALREKREQLTRGIHRQKWDAGCTDSFPGIGGLTTIHASADSLDELLERIER